MQLSIGSRARVRFGPTRSVVACASEIKDVDSSLNCARIYVVESANANSLKIQGTDMWVRMSRILPNGLTTNGTNPQLYITYESPVYHDEEEKREELPAFNELISHPLSDVPIPESVKNKDKLAKSARSREVGRSKKDTESLKQTEKDASLSVSTTTTSGTDVTSSTAPHTSSSSSSWDGLVCTDFETDGSLIRLKPTDECATCFSIETVYFGEGGVHVWKVRIDSDSSSESNQAKPSSTVSGSDICIGIGQRRDESIHDDFSYESYGWGYYGIGGVIHCNPDGIMGRQVRYGSPFSVHDTVSVILDLDAYTLSFGKNDESFGVAFDFNAWTEHHKFPPQKEDPFYLAVMIGRAGSATLVESQHYGGKRDD